MSTAYINIGSNKGDRLSIIDSAVAAISSTGREMRVSAPFESEPWGYDSPHPFINVGVTIEIDSSPVEYLATLRAIELSLSTDAHRNPDNTYRDRALDIDLIAIDSIIIDTPALTLPHPRMHLRPFVLIPMAELAPSWCHPLHHLTPAAMLQQLDSNGSDND